MIGEEFLFAPVLDSGKESVKVYLPAGEWVHLWSGRKHSHKKGKTIEVAAPLGKPALFYRENSSYGIDFREKISALGLL